MTGSWDALFLDIPSSTNLHKFVDPTVTTRQHYEELPTCRNEDGLYLDPEFLVCKTLEHYAYSVVSETVLPLPEARDGGRSWYMSFWVYVANKAGGTLIAHKDSTPTTRFTLEYSDTFALSLKGGSSSTLISLPAGYFYNAQWNILFLFSDETSICKLQLN